MNKFEVARQEQSARFDAAMAEISAKLDNATVERDRLLRQKFHQRFLVTLNDGTGIGGLLVDVDETVIVLANVTYMPRDPKAQQISVDGQLFIERRNVAYLQVP